MGSMRVAIDSFVCPPRGAGHLKSIAARCEGASRFCAFADVCYGNRNTHVYIEKVWHSHYIQ